MKQALMNSVFIICLSHFMMPLALAKEVIMFNEDNIPTAEEMANIFLNSNSGNRENRIKTRSISFGVVEKESPVRIGLPIKFDYDSSVLTNNSMSILKRLGMMLNLEKVANEKVMIEGHTDASGSESYNLSLSKRRAKAVSDYLISNYQIDPARINTAGRGESSPLPGISKFDSLNRRVEFFRIQ